MPSPSNRGRCAQDGLSGFNAQHLHVYVHKGLMVIADDGRGIATLAAFDEALSIIGHTDEAVPSEIYKNSISR